MRNLKKILAMALALVMSLSLMATAGAAETTAVSGTSQYQTAAEVLQGLKVIRGDENGFRFQDSITRVEAAALVYRIATSDVEDAQRDLYTNHPFSDVPAGYWGAGYISYGYNAEIIKGNGNGTVTPDEPVTGYATMAMILRTMGYGKNGEFEGDNWEIQTAAIAKREGLLDGVTATDEARLGQAAPRELVFKILFNALLNETVDFDARYPSTYPKTGETLGYKAFKLEEIEGVVTGNEFADLNSIQVLDEGQTQLETAEGIRDLAISTEITDIGESRYAYITGTKVLAMGDTGKNKVTETGAATEIDTNAKFNSAAEMPAADGIEYYVNFDRVGTFTCDQRLEFVVKFELKTDTYRPNSNIKYTALSEIISDFESAYARDAYGRIYDLRTGVGMTVVDGAEPETTPTSTSVTYSKIIRANEDISEVDLAVIRGIFVAADNNNDSKTRYEGVEGDVYVGTLSNPTGATGTTTYDERDLSNQISYKKFFEDYINDITYDKNWNVSYNGQWVKFVDNNNDGKVEYAFLTRSWLDEAIGAYTNADGDTITEYNSGFDDDNDPRVVNNDYNVRYLNDYTPAIGDKVICALIDNQILVEPANSETVTVTDYSWRDDVVTTDKGDYGQSGIGNATDMMERISGMEDKVEYVVYFDHFGYIRAYELPGGTQYALVTEIYYTNGNHGNLVQNWPMTVELWNGEDGKDEYNLVGAKSSAFVAAAPFTLVDSLATTGNYYNWVQPAVWHLGVTRTGYGPDLKAVTFNDDDTYTFWPANRQLIRDIANAADMNGSEEFQFGTQSYYTLPYDSVGKFTDDADNTTSFTNVAVVSISDEGASLSGAAKLATDKQGRLTGRYATDYIQLDRTVDVAKGAARYTIGGDNAYKTANNTYVNAVHDTEFYIVYNGDVLYFKDFVNMPKLTNKDNYIHAAYAVAQDINADKDGAPYWVADVIVYEIRTWDDTAASNIALAYYTQERSSGAVQLIKTLNNKTTPTMVDLVPGGKDWSADLGQWGADWDDYGFYKLYNATDPEDGKMSARSIEKIDANFNKEGIYAGEVLRVNDLGSRGQYMVVEYKNTQVQIEMTDKVYSITSDDDWSGGWDNQYNEAELLRYVNISNSQVKTGDRVIWMGEAKTDGTLSSSSFIVDLGNDQYSPNDLANAELRDKTAGFLLGWTWDAVNGAWKVAHYSDATVSDQNGHTYANNSLWQKIMREQNAPVGDWEVRATYALADGTPVSGTDAPVLDPDPTLIAKDEGDPVPLAFTNTTNHMVTGVTVASTGDDGKKTAEVYMLADGKWYLKNVTDDTTLAVTVAPATYNVTLAETTMGTGGSTAVVDGDGDPVTLPGLVAGGTELTLTVTPGTGHTVYEVKANGQPVTAEASPAHTYKITVSEATAITVTGVEYGVTMTTETLGANGSVAVADSGANAITLSTTATAIPADETLTLTITRETGYTYTVEVDGTPIAANAGNPNAYDVKITKDTAITVTGTPASSAKELISVTYTVKDGDPVTLTGAGITSTMTVNDLPAGQTTANVTLEISPKATVKVEIGGFEVVAKNGVYSLAVGSATTTKDYTITVTPEDNSTPATYTLKLGAVALQSHGNLEVVTGKEANVAVDTSGKTIKFLAGADGIITTTNIWDYIKLADDSDNANCAFKDSGGTAINKGAVIPASSKLVVTPENGGSDVEYTITYDKT